MRLLTDDNGAIVGLVPDEVTVAGDGGPDRVDVRVGGGRRLVEVAPAPEAESMSFDEFRVAYVVDLQAGKLRRR